MAACGVKNTKISLCESELISLSNFLWYSASENINLGPVNTKQKFLFGFAPAFIPKDKLLEYVITRINGHKN